MTSPLKEIERIVREQMIGGSKASVKPENTEPLVKDEGDEWDWELIIVALVLLAMVVAAIWWIIKNDKGSVNKQMYRQQPMQQYNQQYRQQYNQQYNQQYRQPMQQQPMQPMYRQPMQQYRQPMYRPNQ